MTHNTGFRYLQTDTGERFIEYDRGTTTHNIPLAHVVDVTRSTSSTTAEGHSARLNFSYAHGIVDEFLEVTPEDADKIIRFWRGNTTEVAFDAVHPAAAPTAASLILGQINATLQLLVSALAPPAPPPDPGTSSYARATVSNGRICFVNTDGEEFTCPVSLQLVEIRFKTVNTVETTEYLRSDGHIYIVPGRPSQAVLDAFNAQGQAAG